MRFALAAFILLATPALAEPLPGCAVVSATDRPPGFDATRLKQGRFTYEIRDKDGGVSRFAVSVRRQADGTWRFTGDALGADQHWESVTTRRFAPIRAKLELLRKGRPYRMEITYAHGKVASVETYGEAPAKAGTFAYGGVTVDQRIDWASLMASDLAPGSHGGFAVFDPATGSSRLMAAARSVARLEGPLGARPALRLDYRICKGGEAENYSLYVSTHGPRLMLGEDLRDAEVARLVSIEP